MTRAGLGCCLVGVVLAVLSSCANVSATPTGLGAAHNKQSVPIYTGMSVIGDDQGGFPAGMLDSLDNFGTAVGRIGDINGDDIVDFVVGAPYDDDAGDSAGAVYVLQMTAQLATVDSAFKITEGLRGFTGDLDTNDYFGFSADGVGDVDGNGVEDIAVGARDGDAGFNAGAVYVMLMEANVQVNTTIKITTGQGGFTHALSDYDFFGRGVAGVGDIDGNGVPDIAVGADGTGATDAGAVYVLLMLATGSVSSSTKIANAMGGLSSPLTTSDWFGYRVAALGDVNNDGVPDIAVGAYGSDREGQSQAGSVYILHLTSSGTVGHDYEITSHTSGFNHSLVANERFASPSRVGDVDGDAIDDLAVGAEGSNSVYVLLLDGDGLVRENHMIADVASFAQFGRSVSFVERGPGVSLLVGSPGWSPSGKVLVLDLVDRSSTWPIPPSPSATPTSSPTTSNTPSTSITPSSSATPSITPSDTPSKSITPSSSATSSITPSPTITPSTTPSPTITPSTTPSLSITPSTTPSPTISLEHAPSSTSSPSTAPLSTAPSPSTTPSPSTSPVTAAQSPSTTPSAQIITTTPSPTPPHTGSDTSVWVGVGVAAGACGVLLVGLWVRHARPSCAKLGKANHAKEMELADAATRPRKSRSIANQQATMRAHEGTCPIPLPNGKRFHAFLSHDWGKGQRNHALVSKINDELKKRGVETWFDNDRLAGDIASQLTAGIDDSCVVIVFVTMQYIDKVKQSLSDNCKAEFSYAVSQRKPLLAVVTDKHARSIQDWHGPVAAHLCHLLYHDLCESQPNPDKVDKLVQEIRALCAAAGV